MNEALKGVQAALDRRWPGRFRATLDERGRYQIEDDELTYICFVEAPDRVVDDLRRVLKDDNVRQQAEQAPGRDKAKLN